MTKNDAVWIFLTTLKERKALRARLFDLAESNPEAVIAYVESLPGDWINAPSDDATTDLLKQLHAVALRHLAGRNKP